jgi:hypothetical protein
MAEVHLSRSEWVEIFHALETKRQQLEDGHFAIPAVRLRQQRQHDRVWAAQLGDILRKIGPAGMAAARSGVAPSLRSRRAAMLALRKGSRRS